ncbi:MAG TPA: hypothetical protein DEP37_01085, partial [Algoriphagus sp.]|nr:hypothetical protein [Algoriphagus sp.]
NHFLELSKDIQHAPFAEQAVLGAIILKNENLEDVETILKPEHFFSQRNKYVYETAIKLRHEGTAIDELTLRNATAHNTKNVNTDFLLELTQNTPVEDNVTEYAKIIVTYAQKRKSISISQKLQQQVKETEDVESTLNEYIREIENIVTSGTFDPVVEIQDHVGSVIQTIQDKAEGKVVEKTIQTGIKDLDSLLNGGLRFKHFDILCARPGMGKTSLAVQMMLHASIHQKYPCLFFSIEMSRDDVIGKMLSIHSRTPYQDINLGKVQNWDSLFESAGQLMGDKSSNGKIMFDEYTTDLNQICSLIRKYKRNHDIKFVVIDYLQLMTIPGKYGTRDSELGHCVNTLAYVAKTLDINILALSQLNRGVESRENKRPMLSDLRESGNLEQAAWRVLGIYRDEYYYPDSDDPGIAEIHVLKGKVSNVGNVHVVFKKETTSFHDLARSRDDY